MFEKAHRIPFTALCREKIAAIYVDGAGKFVDGINDGMDDVGTQRLSIRFAKRLGAGCLNFVWRSFYSSPEHIVFASSVDTDHSPHSMIMRHDHHSGCPNHVEDGERSRVKDFLDFSTVRLAQSFEDRRWIGYGTG